MKKFPGIIALLIMIFIVSCNKDEDTWTKYENWRKENTAFFNDLVNEQVNGAPAYERITADWNQDKESYILRKMYKNGDASALPPYYTSTVKVMYKGILYNGTAFDSTYLKTDSVVTSKVSGFVEGFSMALTNMHPGDSCRIVIPQHLGYGAQESGKILPYSTLIFDLKLVEVTAYEHQ